MNKHTESTHQKKISSKETGGKTTSCKGKGTFIINDPNCSNYYDRDGSVFRSNPTTDIIPFDSRSIWKIFGVWRRS